MSRKTSKNDITGFSLLKLCLAIYFIASGIMGLINYDTRLTRISPAEEFNGGLRAVALSADEEDELIDGLSEAFGLDDESMDEFAESLDEAYGLDDATAEEFAESLSDSFLGKDSKEGFFDRLKKRFKGNKESRKRDKKLSFDGMKRRRSVNSAHVMNIVFSVFELICGCLILLSLFNMVPTKTIGFFLLAIIIFWLVRILYDAFNMNGFTFMNFIVWLGYTSPRLVALSALWVFYNYETR